MDLHLAGVSAFLPTSLGRLLKLASAHEEAVQERAHLVRKHAHVDGDVREHAQNPKQGPHRRELTVSMSRNCSSKQVQSLFTSSAVPSAASRKAVQSVAAVAAVSGWASSESRARSSSSSPLCLAHSPFCFPSSSRPSRSAAAWRSEFSCCLLTSCRRPLKVASSEPDARSSVISPSVRCCAWKSRCRAMTLSERSRRSWSRRRPRSTMAEERPGRRRRLSALSEWPPAEPVSQRRSWPPAEPVSQPRECASDVGVSWPEGLGECKLWPSAAEGLSTCWAAVEGLSRCWA
mmetsp:Transcript_83647/g.245265  ORF Transcript_83647/g.245265 Transcript_83647/m.245265 type:complete len:290 (-) Transcript_83647:107-976(-)